MNSANAFKCVLKIHKKIKTEREHRKIRRYKEDQKIIKKNQKCNDFDEKSLRFKNFKEGFKKCTEDRFRFLKRFKQPQNYSLKDIKKI